MEDNQQESVIFPGVLKAICQLVSVEHKNYPFVGSLVLEQPSNETDDIPMQLLEAHALSSKDWRKARKCNLEVNHRSSSDRL